MATIIAQEFIHDQIRSIIPDSEVTCKEGRHVVIYEISFFEIREALWNIYAEKIRALFAKKFINMSMDEHGFAVNVKR